MLTWKRRGPLEENRNCVLKNCITYRTSLCSLCRVRSDEFPIVSLHTNIWNLIFDNRPKILLSHFIRKPKQTLTKAFLWFFFLIFTTLTLAWHMNDCMHSVRILNSFVIFPIEKYNSTQINLILRIVPLRSSSHFAFYQNCEMKKKKKKKCAQQ